MPVTNPMTALEYWEEGARHEAAAAHRTVNGRQDRRAWSAYLRTVTPRGKDTAAYVRRTRRVHRYITRDEASRLPGVSEALLLAEQRHLEHRPGTNPKSAPAIS